MRLVPASKRDLTHCCHRLTALCELRRLQIANERGNERDERAVRELNKTTYQLVRSIGADWQTGRKIAYLSARHVDREAAILERCEIRTATINKKRACHR